MPQIPKRPDYTLLAKASNIAVALVVLTLGGYWLDAKFRTAPVLTVTGVGLGFLYLLFEAWILLKDDQQ